jgi:PHD finger-like domain-containing protein 5A
VFHWDGYVKNVRRIACLLVDKATIFVRRRSCLLSYYCLCPMVPHSYISPFFCLFVCLLLDLFSLTGDGLCCICQSFVNPAVLVHICDECHYESTVGNKNTIHATSSSSSSRCIICRHNVGVNDAHYCRECVQQHKDRDGCPVVVNLGSTQTDVFYERKKYGFKKR